MHQREEEIFSHLLMAKGKLLITNLLIHVEGMENPPAQELASTIQETSDYPEERINEEEHILRLRYPDGRNRRKRD